MTNLDELMRLRESATPGPWYAMHDINGDIAPFVGGATGWVFGEGYDPIDGESYMRPSFDDLEYIVAACNAVPELVQRIRELEKQNGYLADNLEILCGHAAKDGRCPLFWSCPAKKLGKSCGELTNRDWINSSKENDE